MTLPNVDKIELPSKLAVGDVLYITIDADVDIPSGWTEIKTSRWKRFLYRVRNFRAMPKKLIKVITNDPA